MEKKKERTATVFVGGKSRTKSTSNPDLNQLIQTGPDELTVQFGEGKNSTFWKYQGKEVKRGMPYLMTGSVGHEFFNIRTRPGVTAKKVKDKKEHKDLLKRFG